MVATSRCIGALLVLVMLFAALAPPRPAMACSCAPLTIDDLVASHPDVAVARIRRIDPGGGSRGVAEVEEVLHGTDLPDQLPLDLDDGASCLPWVAVGDVAVLSFVPDGDDWRTLECGMLDATTGAADVTVDPAAAGSPVMVLAGSFPGAELLALDDQLRVLAVGRATSGGYGMMACGEDLLVLGGGPRGELTVTLVGLPDLETVAERRLTAGPDRELQMLDAACAPDGSVDVLAKAWDPRPDVRLHLDVFGADDQRVLPAVEDAAFAGDEVVLLRSSGNADRLSLDVLDPVVDDLRVVARLSGATGYEVSVAPDGGHALVRGFDDEPLLLVVDLASGAVVARSGGWWQPVVRPWLAADRLLLIDEDAGGIGGSGLASYRIVDLTLTPVAELAPLPSWNATATGGAIVLTDGGRITVVDADGVPVRDTSPPWAGGAFDAVLLGAVTSGPTTTPQLPPVDPDVSVADGSDGTRTAAVALVGPGVILAGLVTSIALLAIGLGLRGYRSRRPG